MTVTLEVPTLLRAEIGGRGEVSLSASTVREALEETRRLHPALYRGICHENGEVRPHIGVFVGADHIRDRDGLDTPLAPGDVILIFPAVSGG